MSISSKDIFIQKKNDFITTSKDTIPNGSNILHAVSWPSFFFWTRHFKRFRTLRWWLSVLVASSPTPLVEVTLVEAFEVAFVVASDSFRGVDFQYAWRQFFVSPWEWSLMEEIRLSS